MFVCLFVCLSVCLFVCLLVCLSVCMSVCLSICLSMITNLSIYLSFYLSICIPRDCHVSPNAKEIDSRPLQRLCQLRWIHLQSGNQVEAVPFQSFHYLRLHPRNALDILKDKACWPHCQVLPLNVTTRNWQESGSKAPRMPSCCASLSYLAVPRGTVVLCISYA